MAIVAGSLVVVSQPRFGELAKGLVVMNVGLAVFNLLPFPPLDGASILRRVVGMSEETYFRATRWSGLALLLLVNIGAVERVIVTAVALACFPYAKLCSLINPSAFLLIFHQ